MYRKSMDCIGQNEDNMEIKLIKPLNVLLYGSETWILSRRMDALGWNVYKNVKICTEYHLAITSYE